MKTLLGLPILSAVLAALASCGDGSPPPVSPPPLPPAAATDAYPLKTCVVSGKALGSMGDPYKVQHKGVEVRLCCKGCEKKFNEDPAAFAAKVEEARKPK